MESKWGKEGLRQYLFALRKSVIGGGDKAAFERCKPAFQAFATSIYHLGDVGAGQVGKMVNNLILWACISANYEGFKIGEKLDDPLAMYLNDIATIPVNLAGLPGMSVPIGLAPEDGLPVGLQVIAPAMADDRLYNVGAALERALVSQWGAPLLNTLVGGR